MALPVFKIGRCLRWQAGWVRLPGASAIRLAAARLAHGRPRLSGEANGVPSELTFLTIEGPTPFHSPLRGSLMAGRVCPARRMAARASLPSSRESRGPPHSTRRCAARSWQAAFVRRGEWRPERAYLPHASRALIPPAAETPLRHPDHRTRAPRPCRAAPRRSNSPSPPRLPWRRRPAHTSHRAACRRRR